MMKYKSFLSVLFLAWAAVAVEAREQYFAPAGTDFIQLRSELTGREHELLVKVPASYAQNPDRLYPTLYFSDAQWDMALIASIVDKLVYDRALPEIILVGMTYPGADADYGDLRERDLAPVPVPVVNPASGDATKFLQFIEKAVIPRIEADFPADPRQRALGGSSLGGLFALYAMYEKPELFGRYVAITPSAIWADGYLYRRDNEFAEENDALPARLFVSYGGGEYVKYREAVAGYQQKLAGRGYQGLELLNWQTEGERHGGAGIDGWVRGLRWAFADLAPDEPDPVETMFKSMGVEPRIVE